MKQLRGITAGLVGAVDEIDGTAVIPREHQRGIGADRAGRRHGEGDGFVEMNAIRFQLDAVGQRIQRLTSIHRGEGSHRNGSRHQQGIARDGQFPDITACVGHHQVHGRAVRRKQHRGAAIGICGEFDVPQERYWPIRQ